MSRDTWDCCAQVEACRDCGCEPHALLPLSRAQFKHTEHYAAIMRASCDRNEKNLRVVDALVQLERRRRDNVALTRAQLDENRRLAGELRRREERDKAELERSFKDTMRSEKKRRAKINKARAQCDPPRDKLNDETVHGRREQSRCNG